MVCEPCERAMAGGRGAPTPQELRFLEATVWATVLPVQIAAHLLLPVAAVAFKLGYVVVLAGQHASDPVALAAAA